MTVVKDNCVKCPEFKNKECDGKADGCMCRNCPRNLGECLITKYCRETESVIY
ncbi:hypothetical protein [Clostridium ganghwense]|uniref:Alpha/beta hydrolase n=1 Tax=Clostridium ganghwense TaxID=312089 RepID=A0ABT4CUT2_9CLOT|nr:hypothetical protein [Clostridium ganghwense]MCY6372787.1 hypothetical protein [Clostridium ganghwense]